MYARVLVPLDGSEISRQALPYAEMVAKSTGASVTLATVISPFPGELMRESVGEVSGSNAPSTPRPEHWLEVRERIVSDAESALESVAAEMRARGIQVDTVVKQGDPADVLVEEADKLDGTIISMCTHGRSGVGRWVLGSVTDKIVRAEQHAILITRAHESELPPTINRVVLPLDGSKLSEMALPHAVEMAKALGTGVTVLRAVSPSPYGEAYAEYTPLPANDQLNAEMEVEARGYVGAKVDEVKAAGVEDVNGEVAIGSPGTVVLDKAGESGDVLVAMATHGRSGVARWLLGSVTDRVVRHSSGPVLVIRPE